MNSSNSTSLLQVGSKSTLSTYEALLKRVISVIKTTLFAKVLRAESKLSLARAQGSDCEDDKKRESSYSFD